MIAVRGRSSRSAFLATLPLWVTAACGGGDEAGTGGASTGTPSTSNGSVTASTGATTHASSSSAGTGGGAPGRPFAYVGTGDDKIHVFSVEPTAGALTQVSEIDAGSGPSFLAFAPDQRSLYAVNEGSDELAAFSIDPQTGALTFLNRVSSNGGGPAHVAVDATGHYVFGVDYGGGALTMIAVAPGGALGATVTTRSTGANAHELVLDPSQHFAFVPNKGSDSVSQLVFDASLGTLTPNPVPSLAVASGRGPRHMAFHPSAPFAYLIDENDDTMMALSFDASTGRLAPLQTLSTLPSGVDGATNTCAEVAFGKSGRFLYGSNRGHDSIVIYDVSPTTGLMTLVGHQSTGGSTPRHFSIDPSGNLLFVGNQGSSEVVAFRIDPMAGTLTELTTTPMPAGPGFVGVIELPP